MTKKSWPIVIRDPIHGIIPFQDSPYDRILIRLINTKEFQRLRRIKQLGMTEMVFPAANHSRFSHSIGVMHLARVMIDHATRIGMRIEEGQRVAVIIAALLHDIGHGPFSHAFEKVTDDKHEIRTLQIINDPSTETNSLLREIDGSLPTKLSIFFAEDIEEESSQTNIPSCLTEIVSSQLDADRFDYLLRDSHATGTGYGKFDLDWLLLQRRFDERHNRFFIGRKGASAAEAYVFARHHMYQAVYFHKATRAAEVMLKLVFRRYRQLLLNASAEEEKQRVVPDASGVVYRAFSEEKPPLNEYLQLDDCAIVEFLKMCILAKDPLLAALSNGILNRRLLKGIDVTDAEYASNQEFVVSAQEIVKKKGLDPDFSFILDTAADTPYKPYDPDDEKPATQIYLELSTGSVVEISKNREALQYLRKRYSLHRYYFPESIRDDIDRIADVTIYKGGK